MEGAARVLPECEGPGRDLSTVDNAAPANRVRTVDEGLMIEGDRLPGARRGGERRGDGDDRRENRNPTLVLHVGGSSRLTGPDDRRRSHYRFATDLVSRCFLTTLAWARACAARAGHACMSRVHRSLRSAVGS